MDFNKISIYIGKLGHEKFFMELPKKWNNFSFHKKQLIVLPRDKPDSIYDSDVYVINQVMIDTTHNEYNLFVELYKWED